MSMVELNVIEEPVRFHLSLNVPDLKRAVWFYSLLFGMPPTKSHDDYAKFDLTDPPVVFSLVPSSGSPGSTLSHLGMRVTSDATIQTFRERLEAAGICCDKQDGTTCGYAKQNKLWVADPFGNYWEVYRIEEDVQPEAIRTSLNGKAARVDAPECASHPNRDAVVWEHFVTAPLPDRIPHDDETVDEVRLVGTFNASLTDEQRAFLVREAARVLKPGGKLLTHGLMGDRAFAGGNPKLPGLAAMVSRVPVQTEPAEVLARAGFVGIQIVKYTEKAWFTVDGVELREVKFVAWKPLAKATPTEMRPVLYKGPFSSATVDGGRVFERGKRVPVPVAVWEQLRLGPSAEQFLFFEPNQSPSCPK